MAEVAKTEVKAEKTEKRGTNVVANLTLPVSRIEEIINDHGVNRQVTVEVDKIDRAINDIKHEGGPAVPAHVPTLPRKSSDEDKANHKVLQEQYKKDLKAYNTYRSEKFTKLNVLHKLVKLLNSLREMLMKPGELSLSQQAQVAELRAKLNDEKARKKGESDADFKRRTADWVPYGFRNLLGSVNLEDPDAIAAFIDSTKKLNPDLELFLKKGKENAGRVRFSGSATVGATTVAEYIAREVLTAGSRNVVQNNLGRTIRPEHCVGGKGMSLAPLYNRTVHWSAVTQKARRLEKYYADRNLAEEEHRIQASRISANTRELNKLNGDKKTAVEDHKFSYPTFEETEVQNGFCVKTSSFVKGNPTAKTESARVDRTVYSYTWRNLDEEDYADNDFVSYIGSLAGEIFSTDKRYEVLKVSRSTRYWLSNLLIEFVGNLGRQINAIHEYNETILKDTAVVAVVKILLLQEYRDAMPMDINAMLSDITLKVRTVKEHRTLQTKKHEVSKEAAQSSPAKEEVKAVPVAVNGSSTAAKPVTVPLAKVAAKK